MDAQTPTRSSLCLLAVALAATLATGCETLRGFRSDPGVSRFPPGDQAPAVTDQFPTGTPASNAIPGGTVVGAGGVVAPQVVPPVQPPAQPQVQPPASLPQPRPFPAPPGWPTGANGQPMMMPPAPPGNGGPTQFADPHIRLNPTVVGGRGQLAPWETPADRMVEISKHLEAALAQNRDLLARIKELETLGISREQALAEAMREIDAVTAAGVKQRATLQAQIDALQAQIKLMEQEDIVILELMVKALKKLLKENP